MTTNRHVCVLAIILATAGLSLFAYKALLLRLSLTPAARVDAWSIEVRTVFTADGGPVKVQVKLPQGPGRREDAMPALLEIQVFRTGLRQGRHVRQRLNPPEPSPS